MDGKINLLKTIIGYTMDDDQISRMMITTVGWISPDERLYAVDLYRHFQALVDLDVVPGLKQSLEAVEEDCSNMAYHHSMSIPQDEHPEWHVVEMYRDDAIDVWRSEWLTIAYSLGWIRVGIFGGKRTPRLEAEGNAEMLKKHASFIRVLARKLGTDPNTINFHEFEK